MFRNRRLNNHINKIHEKALRIVYQYYNPLLRNVLEMSAS